MTAAEARADIETVREIAYRAKCDQRTVRSLLSGDVKVRSSSARSRALHVIREMGIRLRVTVEWVRGSAPEPAPAQPHPTADA